MNTENVDRAYENLIAEIRAVRRQWRWLMFSEALLKCVWILALVITGAVIVLILNVWAEGLPFSRWGRIGILLLSMGIAIYTVIWTLVLPFRRKLTDAAVAARLETTQTETEFAAENRILSAVQLQKTLADNRLGYAPEFIEHLIVHASTDMAGVQFKQVFQSELQNIRRNAAIAVAGIGLLCITHFFLSPAFVDLARSFQDLPAVLQMDSEGLEKSIQITEVQPGNIRVERGTDVNVTAKVSGHFGVPVELYYRVGEANASESTAKWQSLPMQRTSTDVEQSRQVSNAASPYGVTLEKVSRPLQYYVSVKAVTSPQYQLTISNVPVVTQFQYRLNYPAYTQLQPQTLPVNTGDIQTLFGTEVRFRGESNRPLKEASLAFEESGDVVLEIKEQTEQPPIIQLTEEGQQATASMSPTLQGSFIARQSENYHIHITDVEGFANRGSGQLDAHCF